MNLRIYGERTPARRLAALLRSYLSRFLDPPPATPDYADIAGDIELYVIREEFGARIEEIKEASEECGANPQAYFRERIQTLEALMHQNDQEIKRHGVLEKP